MQRSRQPSPTEAIAIAAFELGLPTWAVRNMTAREYRAAILARAN